jgi:polyisoprenoid-binding protein YceI
MKIKISALILAVFLSCASAQAATYSVDADHSSVGFKIRHLFSKVQGSFNKFDGTIEYEPGKPETWSFNGTIDAASINTNVPERDKHLRGADFFDVEKFPMITFKSTGAKEVSPNKAKLDGVLTLHGVSKPVTLDVDIHGVGKDPWGNVRVGFTASTKLNRKNFGIVWNKALETGDVLLGDEVDILIEGEGIQK